MKLIIHNKLIKPDGDIGRYYLDQDIMRISLIGWDGKKRNDNQLIHTFYHELYHRNYDFFWRTNLALMKKNRNPSAIYNYISELLATVYASVRVVITCTIKKKTFKEVVNNYG